MALLGCGVGWTKYELMVGYPVAAGCEIGTNSVEDQIF